MPIGNPISNNTIIHNQVNGPFKPSAELLSLCFSFHSPSRWVPTFPIILRWGWRKFNYSQFPVPSKLTTLFWTNNLGSLFIRLRITAKPPPVPIAKETWLCWIQSQQSSAAELFYSAISTSSSGSWTINGRDSGHGQHHDRLLVVVFFLQKSTIYIVVVGLFSPLLGPCRTTFIIFFEIQVLYTYYSLPWHIEFWMSRSIPTLLESSNQAIYDASQPPALNLMQRHDYRVANSHP